MNIVVNLILRVGHELQLIDTDFGAVLRELSTSFHSSPYFLRCYEDLCRKYTVEGSRNDMLIGLRRVTSVDMYINNNNILLWGGYILGEILLSRSSLTGDIYFIYVHTILRKKG